MLSQADRARAAQGRGAQLRRPQEPARVRRRRQRSAQGDLPAAHRADGGGGRRRRDRRHSPRSRQRASSIASCRRRASRSMWDIDGPERRRSSATSPCAARCQGLARGRQEPGRGGAAQAHRSRRSISAYEAKVQTYGAPVVRHLEKADHAAAARPALARASRRDGLPAPGHSSAQLRAEESEAGVQARSVRAVHRDARSHQARHGVAAVAHAAAHAGRDRRGRRGASAPPRARDAVPARRARADHRAAAAASQQPSRSARSAQPSRSRSSCARPRRSVATSRVRAARARSTSIVTARWRKKDELQSDLRLDPRRRRCAVRRARAAC